MADDKTENILESPEVKKAIEDAAAAAKADFEKSTQGLVEKNSQLLGEVKTLKTKMKEVDPEEYARLKKLAKEIEDKEHQKSIEDKDMEAVVQKYEGRIAEIMNAKEQEVMSATEKAEKLQASYTRSTTERAVLEALAKRNVKPEVMLNNVLPHIETQFTEDGKFQTIVKDAEGNQRFDPKTNEPVTVDDLLDEFALNPAFAPNFPQASGGNSRDGKPGVNVSGVTTLSDLKTFEDKRAFIEKNGPEEYEKLINRAS